MLNGERGGWSMGREGRKGRKITYSCSRKHIEGTGVITGLIVLIGFERQEINQVFGRKGSTRDERVGELDE